MAQHAVQAAPETFNRTQDFKVDTLTLLQSFATFTPKNLPVRPVYCILYIFPIHSSHPGKGRYPCPTDLFRDKIPSCLPSS